jgi:curved DNA-binding protein CbpA
MKQTTRDPYIELGVPTGAGSRAVRTAYLVKARIHHPDNGGDVRMMARINAAFELLNDPVQRVAYDVAHGLNVDRTGKPPWTGVEGPPPGRPSGSVLDFGIFAGWSLGEIARRDAGYLVWLSEQKEGAPFREEIERIVAPLREVPSPRPGRARFRR